MLVDERIVIFFVFDFFEFLLESQPTMPRMVKSENTTKVKMVKKVKSMVLLMVPTMNFTKTKEYMGTKALKYKNMFFMNLLFFKKKFLCEK